MPAIDDDGRALRAVLATRPPAGLPERRLPRHTLVGGSAYLLERLAAEPSWLGAPVSALALYAAAARSRALLASAATLRVDAAPGELRVTVLNQSGHKLPTGYPSRRMWLHVVVEDARGARLLESGAHRGGALVDASGRPLDDRAVQPHLDRVAAGAGPVVWEAALVDAAGRRTRVATAAARLGKDNRVLPLGFRPTPADAALVAPVGVERDDSFLPGQDTVTFALPLGAAHATVELLYQAIPAETLAHYQPSDGAEARRLLAVTAAPPEPQLIARARWRAGAAPPSRSGRPSPAASRRTATVRSAPPP